MMQANSKHSVDCGAHKLEGVVKGLRELAMYMECTQSRGELNGEAAAHLLGALADAGERGLDEIRAALRGDDGGNDAEPAEVTVRDAAADDAQAVLDMIDARATGRVLIAESGLPDGVKDALRTRFGARERYSAAEVQAAVLRERQRLDA